MVATSKSFTAQFTPQGDLHIPEEAQEILKKHGVKEVVIIADESGILFVPLRMTLEDVRGSVPGRTGVSEDFDEEIEQAIEDEIVKKYGHYLKEDESDERENGHG